MKFSVIIPIYNVEEYLRECVDSVLAQTCQDFELILVDDGSPDGCPAICDAYAAEDERIHVIHKPNGGLVSARKAGLLASRGEYVGYVDGDDWIGPGFYEALTSLAVVSDADMVAAGQSRDLFNKSEHFRNNVLPGLYEGQRLEWLRKEMLSHGLFYRPGITTYVWNKLFRREILLDSQLSVDERITIGEDGAVTYPALMRCQRVYVSDNCAYHYRQREDSMLKKNSAFCEEASKLRVLYESMLTFADAYPEEYGLRTQVNDYLLGICIMRSGGVILNSDDETFFHPFGKDFSGKNVVVYSAGTFGQQMVNRFKEHKNCNVVGWIDDDYWEYRRCCLDVDPVTSIVGKEYDYILVATVDCEVAERIKVRLLDYGISEEKVLTVRCPEEIREELLCRYLY